MTYRTPIEYFSYDKIEKMRLTVKASANVNPTLLRKMPFGTISWTLRNTGGFPIFYALENSTVKTPTHYEELEPDVTVVQDTIPRYIYIANVETTIGNDTTVYFELSIPEKEKERKSGEKAIYQQLHDKVSLFKRLLPRLFGGR